MLTLLAVYKSSKIMTRGKRYDELQMKRRSFSRLIYFPGQKKKTNKGASTQLSQQGIHPVPFLYDFFPLPTMFILPLIFFRIMA